MRFINEVRREYTEPHLTENNLADLWAEIIKWERTAQPLHPVMLDEAPAPSKLSRFLRWSVVSITATILLTLTTLLSIRAIREEYGPAEENYDYVVKIIDMLDAVWKNNNTDYKRGQIFGPDKLQLESGVVNLRFGSGAEILLEGPAELLIVDKMKALCPTGKVSLHVPERARGFEVETPHGRFVDRGTEFFLDVNEKGSQMEVIQGEVELSGLSAMSFKAMEGLRVRTHGMVEKFMVHKSNFFSFNLFRKKSEKRAQEQLRQWEAKRQPILNNSRLLLHYRFDPEYRGEIPNLSKNERFAQLRAQVNRSSSTTGALAGQRALRLCRPKDQIEIPFGHKMDEMTLLISVRLDKLSEYGSILLASDDPLQKPGTFIFQIVNGGVLRLRVRQKDSSLTTAYSSEKYFKQSDIETWGQLAVVFSLKEEKVSFFAEGKPIGSMPLTEKTFLNTRNIFIGGKLKSTNSNELLFHGAVDEFLLFDKALSAEEISLLNWNF